MLILRARRTNSKILITGALSSRLHAICGLLVWFVQPPARSPTHVADSHKDRAAY